MAKQKAPPKPAPKLSDLAWYLLNLHGWPRLKMMKNEYAAGLPPNMPKAQREARIEAIDEVIYWSMFDPSIRDGTYRPSK